MSLATATMSVEGWGHGGIHSSSGKFSLLSLDCDTTEEDNVHVHNRARQTSGLLKYPGQGWDIWPESLKWEGLAEVLWLCLLLLRAKSLFEWVSKGHGYLSLHADSLTVYLNTFLSQWLWPWIDLYFQNPIILQWTAEGIPIASIYNLPTDLCCSSGTEPPYFKLARFRHLNGKYEQNFSSLCPIGFI